MPLENPVETRRNPPQSRHRVWIWACMAAVMGLVLYVLFMPQPDVALGVLVSKLSSGGERATNGETTGKPGLSFHATTINSRTSATTGSSSSRSDGATWPKASVAVFCDSDHLLMQRVGLALFEGLQKTPQFTQVSYVPRGESLEDGLPVPDVLITLAMPTFNEGGIPGSRNYDAMIEICVGRELGQSSYSEQTSENPPVVEFRARMQLTYSATQTGIESSGARYTAVSNDIAKHLQKAISEYLEKGEGIDLPDRERIPEFFPGYQPPPDFAFLKTLGAGLRVQGPRFMQPTYAAWTFAFDGSPDELQAILEDELVTPDWQFLDHNSTAQPRTVLAGRWKQGTERVELLPDRDGFTFSGDSQSDGPRHYTLAYQRFMPSGEIQAALAALVQRQPPESLLLPFFKFWYQQQPALQAYFAAHPPQDIAAIRRVAEWKIAAGDLAAARQMVTRAWLLNSLLHRNKDQSEFKKLAEKAGMPELPQAGVLKTWNNDELATLGLHDLRETRDVVLDVQPGDRPVLWLGGTTEEQQLVELKVSRRADGRWQLESPFHQVRPHGYSVSTGGLQLLELQKTRDLQLPARAGSLQVTPVRTDDPWRLQLKIHRESPAPDTVSALRPENVSH